MAEIYPGTVVTQARVGINRHTGKLIYGWEHCEQCICTLVTTALNTRIMRLDVGAKISSLIDRPANASVLLGWYVAIDTAIRKWEPGYRVQTFRVASGGPDGAFALEIDGIFYPLGHLGDYSIAEQRTATVLFNTAR